MSPRFTTLRPIIPINVLFWKYYIHYEPIMKHILVKSTKKGTMMHELVVDEFLNQSILVPNDQEQNLLGQMLKNIDMLITANQQKGEKLQELKKLLLQKMFVSGDNTQPEIRFNGFTDSWVQRNLKYLFSESNNRSNRGQLLSVTIKQGLVPTNQLDRKDSSSLDKSNYKKVLTNDIVYNSMRMWQGASGFADVSGIVSPAYTVLRANTSEIDPVFFSKLFKTHSMIQMFKRYSQGVTSDTWNLKYPGLSTINVTYPDSLNEQVQIHTILIKLEDSITANQKKGKNLQLMKKLLLQRMFV